MSNSREKAPSISRAAWQGWKRNSDRVLSVMMLQVLVRAAAVAPAFLPSLTAGKFPRWMALILCLALYIALVLPLRCWGGEALRRIFYTRHMPDKGRNPYQKWLKAELLRYLMGMLWGLPFLACVGYFFYGKKYLPYTKMWQPVRNLATIFGQEPAMGLGLPIALGLVLLFGLIFAYGWWRNVMLEYLPVRSLQLRQGFHWARRMRRHHRGRLVGNTAVNILLTLPALAGAAAVLVPYVLNKVDLSLSTDMIIQLLMRLLSEPLPQKQLLLLLAVGVLLYLPFCLFRKTRNAVLAARLIKSHHSGDGHHETHAAG